MNAFNWSCPHCERAVTITKDRLSVEHHVLNIKGADGNRLLATSFFVCPNPDCTKFTLAASLHETVWNNDWRVGKELERWALVPDSRAKNFPEYIPQQILEDYREACTIKSLSPKASATLSRRCLQGMIRDFWSVKPGRLVDEIGALVDGKIRRRSTLMAPAQHAHSHCARGVVRDVADGVAVPLGRLNTSNFSKLAAQCDLD
jgi:hypothetical protein